MGKFVEIREPMIYAESVYKRWTGIHGYRHELANLIDNSGLDGIPTAYIVKKVLDCGNDEIITECIECDTWILGQPPCYENHIWNNEENYDFSNIAYILSEILEYEESNPKLLYEVVEDHEKAWSNNKNMQTTTTILHAGLITISSDEVIAHLRITPIDFVDILNGYKVNDDHGNFIAEKRLRTVDEEAFREYKNSGWNDDFFKIKDIENVRIYQVDFERYCQDWGLQEELQVDETDTSEIQSKLSEAEEKVARFSRMIKRLHEQNERLMACNEENNSRNTELKTALEAANTRIAELKKELAASSATEPPTTVNATKWENSVKAVLEVWIGILQGNKTDWKEDEFRKSLSSRYPDYHTKVHVIAWRALPPAFKNGAGRPKKNPENTQ
jgi:hypothetical protein